LADKNINNYRKTFAEICEGFSKSTYRGEFIYIKHLSHLDYVHYEEIQNEYEELSKSRGLPSEAEKTNFLIKNNLWSKNKESEIERLKDFIFRLDETKKKQVLPSAVKQYESQIKKERDAVDVLLNEKYSLIGMTVESYSQRMVNDFYIVNNIFKNKECSIPFFNNSSFEDLDDVEINEIVSIYNETTNHFNEDNLRKLVLQDFYQSYYYLCIVL
jgi:hypothetical protein